ncbi:unnamed protein product [Angiostrongylus costaricensis]|uniref:C2H2-type domain-containing protein n=1 Tax=Angiostrongylus costaricensis TaxID=334426 RepID=A0A158PM41_ANGCS|nr:unnamed protein product [Angiostrongylus costaricensis]
MDISIDSKHSIPCSSSSFEEIPFAASDSISGWDELVDQYKRHVRHRKAPSTRDGLKSKQHSCNSTGRDLLCNAVKTTVDSRCADGNPITCPVCSYAVTWRFSPNDVPVETLMLKHIQSHEGELDNSLKIPCAVCFNYYYLSDIDKHCNQFHGQKGILQSVNARFHDKLRKIPIFLMVHPRNLSAFDVTTQSMKSYEINCTPSSLNGCPMENSACETLGSNVGEFEEHVPHFGGHTVPTDSGQPTMEDSSGLVANTFSLEPTATDLPSSISNSSELECCEECSDSNPSNVELHKLAVRKKFFWSGPPPPPLSTDQTEQLAKLSRSECPFCKAVRGGRGLRVPESSSDEIKEECMIAHIVKFHHSDPSAAWVLNAKRYHISVDDKLNPLKFLLKPTKDGSLRCSSCERAAFPKISNLRLHWATCIAVCGRYRDGLRKGRCVLVSPSAAAIKTKKSRSINEGKNEHLADEFPFLHVSKSFMNSIERGGVLNLQCVKCDRSFPTPNELVQHAKRYHPTEEHYSGSPRCPILSCKKKLRRWNNITDNVLQLLHVIKEHFLEEEALEWICHWPEKFEFVMEKESVFKFDVLKSLSQLFEYSKYLYHRKRGVCGDAKKIPEAVPSSLKNRKVKVSYVRLRGSDRSNSRKLDKRSYSLKTASITEPVFLNGHNVHGFDENELGSETSIASQFSSLSEVSLKNPRNYSRHCSHYLTIPLLYTLVPASDGLSQRLSDEVALDSPSTVYYNEISECEPMTVAESDSPAQPSELSLLQPVREPSAYSDGFNSTTALQHLKAILGCLNLEGLGQQSPRRNVIGLAETRRRQHFNAVYDTGEELFLGTCDSRVVGGVGVLVNTSLIINVDSFEQLRSRIGRLRLRRCGSIPALTIFIVYAQTSCYGEDKLDTLCADMEKFYREDHRFF